MASDPKACEIVHPGLAHYNVAWEHPGGAIWGPWVGTCARVQAALDKARDERDREWQRAVYLRGGIIEDNIGTKRGPEYAALFLNEQNAQAREAALEEAAEACRYAAATRAAASATEPEK